MRYGFEDIPLEMELGEVVLDHLTKQLGSG